MLYREEITEFIDKYIHYKEIYIESGIIHRNIA